MRVSKVNCGGGPKVILDSACRSHEGGASQAVPGRLREAQAASAQHGCSRRHALMQTIQLFLSGRLGVRELSGRARWHPVDAAIWSFKSGLWEQIFSLNTDSSVGAKRCLAKPQPSLRHREMSLLPTLAMPCGRLLEPLGRSL